MFNYRIKSHSKLLFLLGFALLLVTCGPVSPPTAVDYENINVTQNIDSYPPSSGAALPQTAYPVDGDVELQIPDSSVEAYPSPTKTEEPFREPRFRIDSPLSTDDTVVTGQALPGLPLAVVNITYNGIVLGMGQSNESGQFSIPVTDLPDGHRIGITISELSPGQTFNEAVIELYPHRGTGFMNIPNVGVFFDTILVGS